MHYKNFYIGILQRKKYLKFLISGSLAAMTNLGALYVLHGLVHLAIVPAASISFIIAYLVSFSLQKFWTFADTGRERMAGQMVIYFLVGVFGLVLNAVGMYMLVEVLLVWYLLAQVIMAASLAVMNYFLYRWIFRNRERTIRDDNKYRKILLASYRPEERDRAVYCRLVRQELGLATGEVEFRLVVYSKIDEERRAERMSRVRRELDAVKKTMQFFREVWRQAGWADVVCVRGAASQGLIAYLACRLRCKKYLLSVIKDSGRDKRGRPGEESSVQNGLVRGRFLWLHKRMRAMVAIFVAHGASRIFVPSEDLRKVVTGWGIEEQTIRVFPENVDLAHPSDEQLGSRQKTDGNCTCG
jgi:putative flippase GtrA